MRKISENVIGLAKIAAEKASTAPTSAPPVVIILTPVSTALFFKNSEIAPIVFLTGGGRLVLQEAPVQFGGGGV